LFYPEKAAYFALFLVSSQLAQPLAKTRFHFFLLLVLTRNAISVITTAVSTNRLHESEPMWGSMQANKNMAVGAAREVDGRRYEGVAHGGPPCAGCAAEDNRRLCGKLPRCWTVPGHVPIVWVEVSK
jgi:hypothetical protein